MSKITIAGVEFTIADRYAEGHVLNANEASALNQTFHENIGNNFRKRVKETIGDDGSITQDQVNELQSAIDEYSTSYQFGVRLGGGGGSAVRRDPVEAEAYRIARSRIADSLKAQGRKLKDVDEEKLEAAIATVLEKNPAITEQAREIVEARKGAAQISIADLDLGEGEAPATEGETEAPTTSTRKGKRDAA